MESPAAAASDGGAAGSGKGSGGSRKERRRWRKQQGGGEDGEAADGTRGVEDAKASESALAADAMPSPHGKASSSGKGRGAAASSRASLTAGPFDAGVKASYEQRYADDIRRLYSRGDLGPAARWVDSHCHLESILQRSWRGGGKPQVTDREPLVDLPQLVQLWPEGLDCCVSNFVFRNAGKPGVLQEWAWLAKYQSYFEPDSPLASKLWFTIGLHPHDAASWDEEAEATVRRISTHPKCVGIGECGLDFFKHKPGEADVQLRAFRAQAAIAVERGKALVVHGRLVTKDNEELCMRVLREAVPREHPVHIHCYSDSLEHALALCKEWPNLRIGFTGSITFKEKKAPAGGGKGGGAAGSQEPKGQAHLQELIRGIPLDRLLLETDGPYMCPEPFRGQTAHPGHVHRVAEQIALWQDRPLGEVMSATRASTRAVYRI